MAVCRVNQWVEDLPLPVTDLGVDAHGSPVSASSEPARLSHGSRGDSRQGAALGPGGFRLLKPCQPGLSSTLPCRTAFRDPPALAPPQVPQSWAGTGRSCCGLGSNLARSDWPLFRLACR